MPSFHIANEFSVFLAALSGCAPLSTLDAINDQFEHHHHK